MEDKNNTLKSQLCEIVKTRHEAEFLKSDLARLANALFNTKIDAAKEIDLYVPFDKKEKLLMLFRDNGVNFQDLEATQKFLALTEETLDNLPVVKLQTAIAPRQETIDAISEWFTLQLNREVLLDITVEKDLVAGIVVINNGVVRDYSIKKKINDKFLKQYSNLL